MNRGQRRQAEREARKNVVPQLRKAGAAESTPASITPEIVSFCSELDPTQQPVYVDLRPVRGARIADCYFNVEDEVAARGGHIQYGWIIWELPHVFLIAEFHAVLVRDGQLMDITPKGNDETRVLFLPDSARRYERRVVNAVRRPLCPEAKRYLDLIAVMYEVQLKYERIPNLRAMSPFRDELMSRADQERLAQVAAEALRLFPSLVDLSRLKKRSAPSLQGR